MRTMKKKSAIMQIMIMMMMNMMKANEITPGAGRIFGAGGWEIVANIDEIRLRQAPIGAVKMKPR